MKYMYNLMTDSTTDTSSLGNF